MAEQKLSLANPGELNILAFGNSLTEGYTDFGLTFHPYAIALRKKLAILLPDFNISVDINGMSGDRVLPALGGIFLQRVQAACPLRKRSAPNPKYDLVIMLGGTNDLAYLINDPQCPHKIFEGLKACYDHVLASGASLLCLTIPERAIDTKNSFLANKSRSQRLEVNERIAHFVQSSQENQTKSDSGVDQPPQPSATAGKLFIMDLASMAPFPSDKLAEMWEDPIWSPDGLHMCAQGYDFVGEELASFIFNIIPQEPTAAKQSDA